MHYACLSLRITETATPITPAQKNVIITAFPVITEIHEVTTSKTFLSASVIVTSVAAAVSNGIQTPPCRFIYFHQLDEILERGNGIKIPPPEL
jgi:hypothetical protein